ncbi:myosin-9-like, partial [Trifolium medium]|nr:myosin-9-like [Trifolium medium]
AAREEAWAKVSVLELEIDATMRDLDFERRRLKGARERLMLRLHQSHNSLDQQENCELVHGYQFAVLMRIGLNKYVYNSLKSEFQSIKITQDTKRLKPESQLARQGKQRILLH